jgi:hypothetical protein
MDQTTHLIDQLIGILAWLYAIVMSVFSALETWLRATLTTAGVPPNLQTIILIVVGVGFLLLVVRALGGIVRIILVVLLLLLLLQVFRPLVA